jgi:hypothetical protein
LSSITEWIDSRCHTAVSSLAHFFVSIFRALSHSITWVGLGPIGMTRNILALNSVAVLANHNSRQRMNRLFLLNVNWCSNFSGKRTKQWSPRLGYWALLGVIVLHGKAFYGSSVPRTSLSTWIEAKQKFFAHSCLHVGRPSSAVGCCSYFRAKVVVANNSSIACFRSTCYTYFLYRVFLTLSCVHMFLDFSREELNCLFVAEYGFRQEYCPDQKARDYRKTASAIQILCVCIECILWAHKCAPKLAHVYIAEA